MSLPFIYSPDGIGVTGNALAAMQRRGATTTFSGTPTVISALGSLWFAGSWDGALDYVSESTPHWYGFRLYSIAPSIVATRGMRILATTSLNHLYFHLSTAGLAIYKASNQLTVIPLGGANSVFVEVYTTSTGFEVYLNGAATPNYSTTTALGLISLAPREQAGWRDAYVHTSRLGEGTARILPNTLSVSGGTAGGAASSVADGLASLDDQTKYVTFAPTEKAQLSVADITDNPSAIKAVSVIIVGRKSGTALLPELVTATTASENTIATPVLGVGFSAARVGLATDPHDSSAWTKAKINSLLVGVGSI